MNAALQFAVSNTVVAALAAVVVLGVTRFWRNPHLAHLLWALVLLKLVTPPLIDVAIPVFSASPLPCEKAPGEVANRVAPVPLASRSAEMFAESAPEDSDPAVWRPESTGAETHWATAEIAPEPAEASGLRPSLPAASRAGRNGPAEHDWVTVLASVWGAGSAVWIGLLAVRLLRFNRLVRSMPLASEACQQEIAALAARIGLRVWPGVRLADGAISPLLWTIGTRPVIVLPRALVERLDAAGHRALLAHELAHYYRCDHWMRWFEMFVLAVCWWNPIAWWARRRLRVAEEQCCDAWAVWLLDDNAPAYGLALLETIEFLSDARAISPIGASGMGDSVNLKGRFDMILESPFGRRASWRTRLAVTAAALALLPLSPSAMRVVAQTETPAKSPATPDTDRQPGVSAALPHRRFVEEVEEFKPSNWDFVNWTVYGVEYALRPIRGRSEVTRVAIASQTYGLVSIDGRPAKEIADDAKKQYGERWEDRLSEDLLELKGQFKPRAGGALKVVLRDPTSGETKTIDWTPRHYTTAPVNHEWTQADAMRTLVAEEGPGPAAIPDAGEGPGPPERYSDDDPSRWAPDPAVSEVGPPRKSPDWDAANTWVPDPAGSGVFREVPTRVAAGNALSEADEQQIRQLVNSFGAAAAKTDADALAAALSTTYLSDVTKALAAGAGIGKVRSIIPLPGGDVLALTDFFDLKDAADEGKKCAVYRCARQDDRWLIRDIELKDLDGLIGMLRSAPAAARRRVVPAAAQRYFEDPKASPVWTVENEAPPATFRPIEARQADPPRTFQSAAPPRAGGGLTVKATGPDRRKLGEVAEFVITVTNHGSEPLTNLVVTDTPEASLEPMRASPAMELRHAVHVWRLDSLAPGATKTWRLDCTCTKEGAKVWNRVIVTAEGGRHLQASDETFLEVYTTDAAPSPAPAVPGEVLLK